MPQGKCSKAAEFGRAVERILQRGTQANLNKAMLCFVSHRDSSINNGCNIIDIVGMLGRSP
jgi:hypothetical protein